MHSCTYEYVYVGKHKLGTHLQQCSGVGSQHVHWRMPLALHAHAASDTLQGHGFRIKTGCAQL
eukprot:13961163-Alexandrium_andersonii.AAC.1